MACELTELKRLAEQYAQAVTRHSWQLWMNAHERREVEEFLVRAKRELDEEIKRVEGVIDHLGEHYNGKA